MNEGLSTNKASKKLQKDLELDYGLGFSIVSEFFNKVNTVGNTSYWEPKKNYFELIKNNGTVEQIKKRVKNKSKNKKYWGKDITELLPNAHDRRKLYMAVYKKRLERKKENTPLPNNLLLKIIVEHIGHWNSTHRGLKDNTSTIST